MTSATAETAQPTASLHLRSNTKDLHDKAENSPFQRAMAKGRITKEAYADYLGQMFILHVALETILRDLRGQVPAINSVLKDHHFQEQHLRDDLAFLGVDPNAVAPVEATRLFVEKISQMQSESHLEVLGVLYVLEGANNGGRFIAMNIRKALELTPGTGDRYLDPYGDRQTEFWAAFKTNIDAAVTDAQDMERLLDGAKRVYAGILTIGDEVWSNHESSIAS